MTEGNFNTSTPRPDVFRGWLLCAMVDLSLPATAVSSATGGVNAVGRFLREDGRDISLSRAEKVEVFVRQEAQSIGKSIPVVSALEVASYAAKLRLEMGAKFPPKLVGFLSPEGEGNA